MKMRSGVRRCGWLVSGGGFFFLFFLKEGGRTN